MIHCESGLRSVNRGEDMKEKQMGMLIEHRREKYQLNQQDLADKLGVSSRLVSQWETGKRMPNTTLVSKLCEELHISVNELVSGKKLKEEEERQEIQKTVMLLLNTNRKLKKCRIFHKILCCLGVITSLACGMGGYYLWCSNHPIVDISILQYPLKENIKVGTPSMVYTYRLPGEFPSSDLKIFRLSEQSENLNRYFKNNYKTADIKLEMEEKDGKTFLRYAGPATTLDGEMIEFEKEIILDFALDADITYL